MTLLLIVAYVAVAFVAGSRFGTHLAYKWADEWYRRIEYRPKPGHVAKPDTGQWFGGVLAGTGLFLLWPIALPAYYGRHYLFAPPHEVAARERDKRVAKLEARSARMEQELGL